MGHVALGPRSAHALRPVYRASQRCAARGQLWTNRSIERIDGYGGAGLSGVQVVQDVLCGD